MASRRSLCTGGSYGRVQEVITWALTNWQVFDGWCCVHQIDPLELSSLRFYNLVLYHLREDLTPESLESLEQDFKRVDGNKHPLLLLTYSSENQLKKKSAQKPKPPTIEEPKGYVPSWWRGDNANAKIAMNVMKQLPKG